MLTTAIVLKVLGWVLPILLGPLVYAVARELLNLSQRVDDLPAFAKRLIVTGLGLGVVAAFNALGIAVPAECVALANGNVDVTDACARALTGGTVVKGVTAALAAMILHALKKSNPRD